MLLSFAPQAGAQSFKQPSGPHRPRPNTRGTRGTKAAAPASGYTYSVLYSFCSESGCADGASPYAGIVRDAAGNLFGTTGAGGINSPICYGYGCGTVFKIDTTGKQTVFYSFCSTSNCTDGAIPFSGLIQDSSGNLYGTTDAGGTQDDGAVFKITSAGQETVLHSFCSVPNCADGGPPEFESLIQDTTGNLYGSTTWGGAYNYGTVFMLDNAGQETVLYSFCPGGSICTDGSNPKAGLIQDAAGNLYGTTEYGGAHGAGALFKVNSTGQETVLYSFCFVSGCTDGGYPQAGLIQDASGNLYGTTLAGGNFNADCGGYGAGGCGVIFKVDSTGHETVLYSFCSAANCTDGEYGWAGLIQDAAGDFFGTTQYGGANGGGVVFELDTAGHYTALYSFCAAANCTDGQTPEAGLIMDSAGNLYGTTTFGGNASSICGLGSCGVVFELIKAIPQTPTVTVTPSAQSITTAQTLSVTVAVSYGSGNPTPTGTVTLTSGSYTSATTTLSSGSVAINIPAGSLAVGTDTLTATYSGDSNYTTATGTASVTVTAAPGFTIAGTAVSVIPGATSGNTSTITVTPAGGFTGSVTLTSAITSSPAGAQYPPTLSFGSTSPVIITNTSGGTATLTISTTPTTSVALAHPVHRDLHWYAASSMGFAFATFMLSGIPLRGRRWRIRSLMGLVALSFVLVACGGSSGGGGGGSPGTTAGTYTMTVTGTSGSTTATSTVTLTVQ
jgi:uncharacterized repeat protein (TIGR03803 family)